MNINERWVYLSSLERRTIWRTFTAGVTSNTIINHTTNTQWNTHSWRRSLYFWWFLQTLFLARRNLPFLTRKNIESRQRRQALGAPLQVARMVSSKPSRFNTGLALSSGDSVDTRLSMIRSKRKCYDIRGESNVSDIIREHCEHTDLSYNSSYFYIFRTLFLAAKLLIYQSLFIYCSFAFADSAYTNIFVGDIFND